MRINKDITILVSGRAIQVLISFFTVSLTTYILDPSALGSLYLLVAISAFISMYFINPVAQYINRYTHHWYQRNQITRVLFYYNFYIFFVSILAFPIVELVGIFGVSYEMEPIVVSLIMFFYIYSKSWYQTFVPMLNILEHRMAFVFFTILMQILYIVIAYLLTKIFSPQGYYWFFGQSIAYALVVIASFLFFKQMPQFKADKMIYQSNIRYKLQDIWSYSFPLSFGVLFLWLQTQSYNVIIGKYLGNDFLGYLGIGFSLSTAIFGAIESIVNQYFQPILYKSMNDLNHFPIVIQRIIKNIFPIYFALAVTVTFFAEPIMKLLVDQKYYASSIYLVFGIWIAFFRSTSILIGYIAHATKKTKSLLLSQMIGGATALIGVWYFVQTDQYKISIPIILLISYLSSFIFMFYSMNKLMPIFMPYRSLIRSIVMILPLTLVYFVYEDSDDKLGTLFTMAPFGIYILVVGYFVLNSKDYK